MEKAVEKAAAPVASKEAPVVNEELPAKKAVEPKKTEPKAVSPVVEEGQSLVDITGMDGMDLSQIPIPGDSGYVPQATKAVREEDLAKDLGKIRKTEYKRTILSSDDDKY